MCVWQREIKKRRRRSRGKEETEKRRERQREKDKETVFVSSIVSSLTEQLLFGAVPSHLTGFYLQFPSCTHREIYMHVYIHWVNI